MVHFAQYNTLLALIEATLDSSRSTEGVMGEGVYPGGAMLMACVESISKATSRDDAFTVRAWRHGLFL